MANRLKRVHWWAAAVTVSGNLCRKDLFLSTSSRTEHSQNLKGSKICTIILSSEKVSAPDANFAEVPRIFKFNMFKLSLYIVVNKVKIRPSLNFCRLKRLMKLEGYQKRFKATL